MLGGASGRFSGCKFVVWWEEGSCTNKFSGEGRKGGLREREGSDQQIVIFPANRNRNRLADTISVQIGI